MRKFAGTRVALFLAVGAAFLLGAGNADYKIERSLLNRLTDDADAKAPFFVIFGERAAVKQAHAIPQPAARARFVADALQATANRSQAAVHGLLRARGLKSTPFWIDNSIYVPDGTLELARTLAERPEVAAIVAEVIYSIPPYQVTAAVTQGAGWNISKIRADQAWTTTQGAGIVVANIDTGVQYNHPALVQQYRGNRSGSYAHIGNWKDPTGVCGSTPCDNSGHGTHTMGTMVGDDSGTNPVGVAPKASWIACKGCADNSCYSSHLKACAQWIVSPDGAAPPNIVNNSWGGGSGDTWYQGYVRNWRAAGIFPAFSGGNNGPGCGTASSPGDYPESFASGATDSSDVIASFSSRGPSLLDNQIKPNVAAPGADVRSSWPANTYATVSGTSMASPHTAGTVALLWAAQPGYRGNIGGTEQLIKDSAVRLTTSTETCGGLWANASPNNTYGWGRIDALAAISATGPVNQPPVVSITAPSNGAAVNCGVPVSFAATASDPDGPTPSVQWTDNGAQFSSGLTASKTYACVDSGSHNIIATAADSKGAMDTDTITIAIVDPNTLAAPSDLAASVSGATVNLAWKDNSTNENGFRIERKKAKGGGWRVIGTTGANAINYADSPGKGAFQYRVTAFTSAATSATSNVVQVTVN